MGKTMATPSTIMKIVKPRDAVEEGYRSPYPTVAQVAVEKYTTLGSDQPGSKLSP